MARRIWILLRARLAARGAGAAPVAAVLMQALISGVLLGLVRQDVTAFTFALLALAVSGALVALPLLGELAQLLDADEAGEWAHALPVRPAELRLARLAHLILALWTLALGSLVPAALLAPPELDLAERLLFVGLGLGQTLAMAAALLVLRRALGNRAQALLVLAQTSLFVLVIVGGALGPRFIHALDGIQRPQEAPFALELFPPAWFAAALAEPPVPAPWRAAAPLLILASILLLLLLPAPPAETARRGAPLLTRLLAPVRALAVRTWVRRGERASFELVFDALPREREFVLRTYPLMAVPLAFLLAGARGEATAAREGLLALLLFTPGAYLPILLAHLPATDSAGARWLLDLAPRARAELESGALKALAVRFLLPLYTLLALLCWSQGGLALVLRLALPAFLVSLLVLRGVYARCVVDLPLSVPTRELVVHLDWLGMMMGLGLVLTLAAVLAARMIATPAQAWLPIAALLALLGLAEQRAIRPAADSMPAPGK